jgi:DNA polymerase-3 subunit delta'
MQFSQIVGLEDIKEHLIASVKNNHVAHAQMFLGKEGSANFALARAYSTYVNCENPSEVDSCGECPSCNSMANLVHPDLHFLYPDISAGTGKKKEGHKAETLKEIRKGLVENPYLTLKKWGETIKSESKPIMIGVEEGRNMIKDMSLKSFGGNYRIVFVWLPELMNTPCANAILKILEEPPAKTLFLLMSNDIEKNLVTIRSRCQIVKVRAFKDEELLRLLKLDYQLDEEKLAEVVHLSDGSVSRARYLLEHSQNEHLDLFRDWLRFCFKQAFADVALQSELFQTLSKAHQKGFFRFGDQVLREVLVTQANQPALSRTPAGLKDFVTGLAKVLTIDKISEINKLFDESVYHVDRNANARIVFMDTSFKVARILKG